MMCLDARVSVCMCVYPTLKPLRFSKCVGMYQNGNIWGSLLRISLASTNHMDTLGHSILSDRLHFPDSCLSAAL